VSASADYNYSTAIVAPPTGSQLRLDAVFPYSSVTRLFVSPTTTDNRDIYRLLLFTPVGEELYLQDRNDHTQYVHMRLVAAAIDRTTYVELPVAWIESGAVSFGANQVLTLYLLDREAAPTAGLPSGGIGPWPFEDDRGLHIVSIVEVPPAAEPIDATTAKLYARVAGTDLDPLIDGWIKAAREKVETDSGYALLRQTRRLWFDRMPVGVVTLPPCCEPVQQIQQFAYIDAAGLSHDIDLSQYQVDTASHPPRIYVAAAGGAMRSFQPVTMQLVAGYSDATAVPSALIHACGLLTGFYANESGDRFLAADLWDQYDETIAPYRLVTV
jgi:uncharacterized phiE125 gp8 family phage protein